MHKKENITNRQKMRGKWILSLIILLVSLQVYPQGKVYDFSLKNTENQTVNFSEISGSTLTVIDFWATWCQPCIRSMPKLVSLSEAFREHGVGFIGISVDSPRNTSKVKPFASSLGIRYPVLLDSNGELMGELNVTAVPTLMIIGSDYRVLYIHEGFNAGDEDVIREEIEKHLASRGH
jgi:peroxiredoxin